MHITVFMFPYDRGAISKDVRTTDLSPCDYTKFFSSGYYVQDYQGNNRMVVHQYMGSDFVGQTTHYYPFGGVIGDISTNQDLQDYKYSGKEFDRTYGLDFYDFHARQYDPKVPRFTSIDPKAEDYYGISPYAYCAGDPVDCVDPDGRDVKPCSNASLIIILNTLPKESHQYIELDHNGYIDAKAMLKYKGESGNYQALFELVQYPIDIQVTTDIQTEYVSNGEKGTEYFNYIEGPICKEDYDRDFLSCNGNITGESGNLGVTYLPTKVGERGKSDFNNPNSIHININPFLSPIGAAESFSHEGYGHALIYVQTQDRNKAVHHPINNGNGNVETNQLLIEKSIKARKETIINMK